MLTTSTPPRISQRELQVLELLAEGYSCRGISETLSIAETTVKTHKKNLKLKLEVKRTTELIYLTSKMGLI
jgi:DNA-binding NarL/FixJ family response regulator